MTRATTEKHLKATEMRLVTAKIITRANIEKRFPKMTEMRAAAGFQWH